MAIKSPFTHLNSMTIRHKLWGGFFLILAVLLVVSVKTLWSVENTQQRVSGMTQDYQPTLIAAMDVSTALKNTTTAMGFYLLTQQPDYQHSYEVYLQKMDDAMAALQQTALVQHDAEGKNVGTLIGWLSLQLFGGHVADGA